MRQTVDQVTEINNLGNGVDKIKLDDDLKQSNDLTILPNIDNCDLKDKKVISSIEILFQVTIFF